MRGHAKGEEAIGADDGIRTRDPHPGKGAWFVHVRPPVFIIAGERRGPSATANKRMRANHSETMAFGANLGANRPAGAGSSALIHAQAVLSGMHRPTNGRPLTLPGPEGALEIASVEGACRLSSSRIPIQRCLEDA